MGGAVSAHSDAAMNTIEAKLTASAPVQFAALNADGSVEYRDQYHDKYDPTVGRLAQRNTALEAQAAAHWNRMIDFAVKQQADGNTRPPCPACARGDQEGPKCRLCGAEVSKKSEAAANLCADGSSKDRSLIEELECNDIGGRITSVGDPDHDRETKRRAVAMLLGSSRRKPQASGNTSAPMKNKSNPDRHGGIRGGRDGSKGQGRGQGRKAQGGKGEPNDEAYASLLEELEELEKGDQYSRLLSEERPMPPEAARLPPVQLQLRERTGTSIAISWDDEYEVTTILNPLLVKPVYEVVCRKAVKIHAKKEENVAVRTGNEPMVPAPSIVSHIDFWSTVAITEERRTTVENLLPNTQYEMRCRRKWWGRWGPIVTIRSGPGPPSAPKGICVKEITSSSVLIAWQPPEEDNGLPITSYTVTVRSGTAHSSSAATTTNDGPPTTGDNVPSAIVKGKLSSSTKTDSSKVRDVKEVVLEDDTNRNSPKGKGKGVVLDVHSGRERLYLSTNLPPNSFVSFEVRASNRAGLGQVSDTFTVKTLEEGAASMTPWVEAVDDRAEPPRLFYRHPSTGAVVWTLPKGALIDKAASLKSKRIFLSRLFQNRFASACIALKKSSHINKISVSRQNLLIPSLQKLLALPLVEVQAGPVRISFEGEAGIDAGGLAKDWFGAMGREMIDRAACLLLPSDRGDVHIDVRAAIFHAQEEISWLFRSVGLFIAKALQDGQTLGFRLSPSLLMHLLGREATLNELAEADPLYYRGLTWVLENDVADADLTFSTSFETQSVQPDGELGEPETRLKELVPFGLYKEVTETNKGEYVKLMKEWLSRGRFEPALSHMIEGFRSLVQPSDLIHVHVDELQLLLGGTAQVEVDDIAKDVQLQGGFEPESPQVKWLWDTIREMDQKTISSFLAFVTGCAHFPVDGLHPPMLLTLSEGADAVLPRAHTCFNQLVMPAYSSQAVLQERLQYALLNTDDAFYIA